MKNKRMRGVALYALAGALLAGGIINVAPGNAASSEAVLYVSNLAVKSPRLTVQQWGAKRTLGTSSPAAYYKHKGWDVATGIYTFSIGLRNASGTQFARTQITSPTSNYGTNYTFKTGSGSAKLPAVNFYLNTKWDKAGGGNPAERRFYGDLYWQGP